MARKTLDFLGIYIDYNKVIASIAKIDNNKVLTKKIFEFDIDYKVEGLIKPLSLNLDFFNEKQQWVIKFKESFKKNKIETTSAIISLSHNFSITRFFSMPYIERKFWNKAIPIESKKHIPVAFDELGYDFWVSQIVENQKLGIIFSVTQKKTTEFLMQLLKECEIKIEIIEPVVYSFYRIAEYLTLGKETYFFIYTQGDEVYTCLIWKKIPILYRYISFSKSLSFSDRKTLDLKGSLMFLQRNIPSMEVKDIFIIGDNIDFISSQVKKELQLEPKIIEIKNKFEIEQNSFPLLMSLSASLNDKIKSEYIIDISENQKNKRITDTVNKFIIYFTGLIVFLFISLYLINLIKTNIYENKISSYYSQMTEISEFENTPIAIVEENVKKISKIAKAIRNLLEKREYFTPKLVTIADTIPKDVWIKSISFTNPSVIDPSNTAIVDFVIEGETILVGETRTYYLDYFVKELKKRKSFEVCVPPRGRLDYEAKDPDIGALNINVKNYLSIISNIKLNCSGKK